jgi:hypothetical protein
MVWIKIFYAKIWFYNFFPYYLYQNYTISRGFIKLFHSLIYCFYYSFFILHGRHISTNLIVLYETANTFKYLSYSTFPQNFKNFLYKSKCNLGYIPLQIISSITLINTLSCSGIIVLKVFIIILNRKIIRNSF